MQHSQNFKLSDLGSPQSPLGSSHSLMLQASAGTGKTYSLERIVLYLLLMPQGALELRQILMVTFTEAATQELRERIRSLLFAYIHDPQARQELLQEIGLEGKVASDGPALEALSLQLERFGSAHIHTIHGFCQWVLAKHALEAGLPRSFALDTDALQDSVQDYLRERFLPGPGASGATAFGSYTSATWTWLLEALMKVLGESASDADKLGPALSKVIAAGYLDPTLYHMPRKELHEAWEDLVQPRLDRVRGIEQGDLPLSHPDWAEFCKELSTGLEGLDGLDYPALLPVFGGKKGAGDTSPGNPTKTSTNATLEFCRRVGGLHLLDLIYHDYLAFMETRPDFLSRLGYDDLIRKVHRLVKEDSPSAKEVRSSLGQEFQAVLLDEFQDTDRLQWEIFNTLFGRSRIMAVGDPKQSIYGFRGADLGTFLEARSWFGSRRELGMNFRSSFRLQNCINTIFGHAFQVCKTPALDIDCPPVEPGRKEEDGPTIRYEGQEIAPLGIISPDMSGATNTASHRKRIFGLVVSEIAWLLDGKHHLCTTTDEEDLRAEDICILCESFKDAGLIRDLLAQSGIPASIRGRGDLKDSQEIKELEVLCRALQDPRDDGVLNCLLLGRLCGLASIDLENPGAVPLIEHLRATLLRWKMELPTRGFLPVFHELVRGSHLDGTDTWARLFAREGDRGLRSQTNFVHLAELFQAWLEDCPQGLSQPGYAFAKFRTGLSSGDEAPLRLDRDHGAVCIMTQHASKGLEFPVVFALIGLKSTRAAGGRKGPDFDLYDQRVEKQDGSISYQRSIFPWKLAKDSIDPRLQLVDERTRHEKLRLYYVAATRAKALLYLPWIPLQADPKTGKTKAVLLLEEWSNPRLPTEPPILNIPQSPEYRVLREAPPPRAQNTPTGSSQPATAALWDQRVQELSQQMVPPPKKNLTNLESASFTSCKKQLSPHWRHDPSASRTAPESGAPGTDEAPPGEPVAVATGQTVPGQEASPGTPPLPGGINWGLVFHDVMASLDYGAFLDAWEAKNRFADCPAIAALIKSTLQSKGLKDELLPKANAALQDHPLCRELHKALTARLPGLSGFDSPHLSIADLIRQDSFCHHREIEFQARVPGTARLRDSLKALPGFSAPGRDINLYEGFLNGAMDLVFRGPDGKWHIIDWKTNTPPAQSPLAEADTIKICADMMEQSFYHLQALIYQSVLALWLRSRGQEDLTGSVWYIFTRAGTDAQDSSGPSPHVVEASRFTLPVIQDFLRESGLSAAASTERTPS